MKNNGNSFFYEVARWLAAGVAVFFLLFLFGGGTVSAADPWEVARAVTGALDMDGMLLAENQHIRRFYGLEPSDYDGCILYYPSNSLRSEEILIVRLHSLDQQKQVEEAIARRLDSKKQTFLDYGVESFENGVPGYGAQGYDLLENHTLVEIKGNFILLVVGEKWEQAQLAFLSAL